MKMIVASLLVVAVALVAVKPIGVHAMLATHSATQMAVMGEPATADCDMSHDDRGHGQEAPDQKCSVDAGCAARCGFAQLLQVGLVLPVPSWPTEHAIFREFNLESAATAPPFRPPAFLILI